MLAGLKAAAKLKGLAPLVLPDVTMMGRLAQYVSGYESRDFQPMGANFGILAPLETPIRDKRLRYEALSARALEALGEVLTTHALFQEK